MIRSQEGLPDGISYVFRWISISTLVFDNDDRLIILEGFQTYSNGSETKACEANVA